MNIGAILRNIFNLSIAEVVSRVLNFISYIYLARVILADGFGTISFIVAFASYFLLIVNFSSDIIANREIARLVAPSSDSNKELTEQSNLQTNRNIFVNKILSLKIVLASAGYVLLGSLVLLLNQTAVLKTCLLIYGLTFFAQALNTSWYFKGIEKTTAISLAQISSSLINLLLVMILIKNKTDLVDTIAIFTSAAFINSIIMLIIYKRRKKLYDVSEVAQKIRWILDIGFIKNNLKESFPVALAGIMISIYYNLDHVMLGYMTSTVELGYYAAAYKIIIIALLPAGIIYQSFLPQLSRVKNDFESRTKLMETYSKGLLIIGSFFTVMLYLFANSIISVVFGDRYINSAVLLQILSLNIYLVYLNMTYGNPLIAWDKQKVYSYSIIAGALSNIILNFILIPIYHATGAAIATISSELVVMIGIIPTHFAVTRKFHAATILKSIVLIFITSCIILYTKELLGLIPRVITSILLFVFLIYTLRLTDLTRIRMLFHEI